MTEKGEAATSPPTMELSQPNINQRVDPKEMS